MKYSFIVLHTFEKEIQIVKRFERYIKHSDPSLNPTGNSGIFTIWCPVGEENEASKRLIQFALDYYTKRVLKAQQRYNKLQEFSKK